MLLYGELPDKVQYETWSNEVMRHTFVHTGIADMMQTFNYDAHPMGMFISGIAAMSTYHPEANPGLVGNDIFAKNKKVRNKQFLRLLGKVPTVAAMSYRNRIGRDYNLPQNGRHILSYI